MNSTQDIAYSYIRFSSRKQEAGDSIRRQQTAARAWARRNGIPLDTTLRIDKGISAFHGKNADLSGGKNADLGGLAEFLRLVQEGTVNPGSYLVVENLD